MKIVSDVLLLSDFDKFGLRVTVKQGKLWRFYIVKRGYIRDPVWRVLLSRLLHVLHRVGNGISFRKNSAE